MQHDQSSQELQQALSGFFAIGQSLLNMFKAAWQLGFAVIKLVIVATFTAGQAILNVFSSAASRVVNAIRSAFQAGFNAIRAVVLSVINFAISKITEFMNRNATTVNAIRNAFSTAFRAVQEIVARVVGAILGFIENLKGRVNAAASFIRDAFVGAFNRLKDIAGGVINGIKSGVEGITGKLQGAVDWVRKLTSGFQPPAWLSNALGLGGTGFAVPQVMPTFGAGQAMGGTGAPVGPAIFARTGSGVRRNEHAERPSVTVHQTVNPSPGMDERELATKTSRELMYRIGY
ncbi:hypothetical protein BMR85_027640 [Achromobacter sp. KAs 3-5]|nr:hypothetical protein BMR85_027640 [Achromobacter sp. KAs 3-5]